MIKYLLMCFFFFFFTFLAFFSLCKWSFIINKVVYTCFVPCVEYKVPAALTRFYLNLFVDCNQLHCWLFSFVSLLQTNVICHAGEKSLIWTVMYSWNIHPKGATSCSSNTMTATCMRCARWCLRLQWTSFQGKGWSFSVYVIERHVLRLLLVLELGNASIRLS